MTNIENLSDNAKKKKKGGRKKGKKREKESGENGWPSASCSMELWIYVVS